MAPRAVYMEKICPEDNAEKRDSGLISSPFHLAKKDWREKKYQLVHALRGVNCPGQVSRLA